MIKEVITTPNGSTLTRIADGPWEFKGTFEDYFPLQSDESLRTDIRWHRIDLATGTAWVGPLWDGEFMSMADERECEIEMWLALKELTLQQREEEYV